MTTYMLICQAMSPGTPVTTTTSSISLDTRTRPPDLSGNHFIHQHLTYVKGKICKNIRQYFKVRERSIFLLSLWLSRPAEVPKMVLHHCSKVLICVFSCTIIFLILTVYALVWHSWSWCVAWSAGAAPLQGGI